PRPPRLQRVARASHRPRGAYRAPWPLPPHDRQRHGTAPPRRRPRHPEPRPLRADERRAQRALRHGQPGAPESRRQHGGRRRDHGVPRGPRHARGRGVSRLSVTVIAWNEEERLRACLESVAWADEIVVIDAEAAATTPPIPPPLTHPIR